ncbi:23S rRNA (guanosine(2251)-2'-O)-methyltransferase RlmB [Peptoniphilus catoniae]|uniref:23S rRNA (guanosine(2251)-2'-O)-methyltransferase RlmB n=1 Tax=Peptoniphilus catoniae TaxID=1660341 RepID=UPI0010FDB21D|nr:23S rRNA (guanosine(2251)-2'-O)-methyltransferase RlmB [Peptoniphilus catoniae]
MEEYIYGRNPVIEVLKSGKVDKLYIQNSNSEGSIRKIYAMAKEKKVLISQVNKSKLDSLSRGENHQGVVALVAGYNYAEFEDLLGENIVILDKIEDPHNLGAVARSAEALGFKALIIPKHKSAYVNSVVYKTSAGAIENLKVYIAGNLSNDIERLKEEGYWIYGADMQGDNLYKTDISGKIAIVLGNEGKGISQALKKHCDVIVSIPMSGQINSLNVSCAASIIMAEIQRKNEKA